MRGLPNHFVESVLELTCTIQAIPAPTFNESKRAAFFLSQFNHHGLADVHIDAVGNVLGRIPGQFGKKPLVVSAHMDTVHPLDVPLNIRRQQDRIIGPGIGDNALGLAAVIGLVRLLRMRKESLPGDLWLAINVSEEGLGDLRGIQTIVDHFGNTPLAYIVVEGMGLGTILHRGLGVERYRISVHAPGGHSWVDYGAPSAIHELCAIVNHLAALPLPRNPCTTLNVGIIHGGTSVNTIAADAWLELDLRSENSATLENLVCEVKAIIQTHQTPNVHVRIERIGKRLAGDIPANHPLVGLSRKVIQGLGIEPHLDIASTDANLPLSRGYPAICLGITHGNNAHTKEEYILTGPVGQGLEQLYEVVTQVWSELS
jgi:tripeptide aminopeptidase